MVGFRSVSNGVLGYVGYIGCTRACQGMLLYATVRQGMLGHARAC